jgi:molybdopterin molybdotransferase
MKRGDVVLRSGGVLTPAQIGLAAEVGRAMLSVVPRPRVAILSTGDELVPAGVVPSAGQIRNSNGPLLAALTTRAGGVPVELGIARDDRVDLRAKIAEGLKADALVLSGGVSAGVLDLVPSVLEELGVQQVFHKVNVKPGKPLWFGSFKANDGAVKSVFGLPGNPVSTLVCFELFVRPAIERLSDKAWLPARETQEWTLLNDFVHNGDRPTYWPGIRLVIAEGKFSSGVVPLEWKGSGDLRTIAEADCLICFPAGDRRYAAGETVQVRAL